MAITTQGGQLTTTAIQLRDYQVDLVDRVREALRRTRRVLAQLPTGGGKTACASFMAHGAAQRGLPTWFICHRAELLTQTHLTFQKYGIPHGMVGAGFKLDVGAPVQVCSIDTLKNRLHVLPPPKQRLWDECHHLGADGWREVQEARPDCYDIGFSATPERLDGQGLEDAFGEMVCGPQSSWLIEHQHLSDYRYFAPPPPANLVARGKGDGVGGQSKILGQPKLMGDVVSHWQRHARGLCTVGFACNVAHSRAMVAAFQAAGIPSAHIDGTTPPDERRRIIRDFALGKIVVLWNVALIGEGFDLSAIAQMDVTIDCVILNRKTQSLSLFLQWVGRALRPAPGKWAIILDHGGNREVHGMPDDDREWTLQGAVKGGKGGGANDDGPPPPITCTGCFQQIKHPLPDKCPTCGEVLAPAAKPKEIKVADGHLEEVTSGGAEERKAKRRDLNREQAACTTMAQLIALAHRRGHKSPQQWAYRIWSSPSRVAARKAAAQAA
jgi:DNA repair protein RadD